MTRPALVLAVLAAVPLPACAPADPGPAAVARVGDAVLTEADLAAALAGGGAADSTLARRRAVERWVDRELLVQAARAAGLDRAPDVRWRADEAERAVLAAAALDRRVTAPAPTEADLRAAYARERDDLVLNEPYVRVRHLRTGSREAAEAARALLNEAAPGGAAAGRAAAGGAADVVFEQTARLYADDVEGALALAAAPVPERWLGGLDPDVAARAARLPAGGPAVVVGGAGGVAFHVVQVVDRAREGEVPPFEAVRGDLAERLAVRSRRRAEAQFLRSLRAEARAAGRLDLPDSP